MMNKWRISNKIIIFFHLIIFLMLSMCDKPSKIPPPDTVILVLNNVREGYNKEDVDRFCNDFSDIMFTKGFTKKAYLDVIQGLKKRLGEWESEIYLGIDKGAYTWRVKFKNGTAKLVLVLNNDWQVIGLWFR